MKNSIFVIKPYKWNGMWVFDDERVGLDKEPFVAGARRKKAAKCLEIVVQKLGL